MWDLSLPGYKYLGPGNKLNKGKPVNYNDHVAEVHDWDYDHIEQSGKNPYRTWSNADQRFVDRVSLHNIGGTLGYSYFKTKQSAYQLGFIDHAGDMSSGKRKFNQAFGSELPYGQHLRIGYTPAMKRNHGRAFSNEELPRPAPALREANAQDRKDATQPNLQSSANMADGAGSGNTLGTKETPVDNPYVVFRGPPDYTFSSLPYSETRMNLLATTSQVDHIYRMTSVYDCRVETAQTDINTGAGIQYTNTESEATQRKARWFDFYAGMYNYYHVISCSYNIFIENLSGEPIWVYQLFYNDDIPNAAATNEDMQLWNNVEYKYLDRRYLAISSSGVQQTGDMVDNEAMQEDSTYTGATPTYTSGNHVSNDANSKTVFSGEYKPGDFTREIKLDASVENWTAINTNPTLPEKLVIRIKPTSERTNTNSATSGGETLKYKIQVKLNYLVEFKELGAALRYPVQRQPITVTLASDVSSTD